MIFPTITYTTSLSEALGASRDDPIGAIPGWLQAHPTGSLDSVSCLADWEFVEHKEAGRLEEWARTFILEPYLALDPPHQKAIRAALNAPQERRYPHFTDPTDSLSPKELFALEIPFQIGCIQHWIERLLKQECDLCAPSIEKKKWPRLTVHLETQSPSLALAEKWMEHPAIPDTLRPLILFVFVKKNDLLMCKRFIDRYRPDRALLLALIQQAKEPCLCPLIEAFSLLPSVKWIDETLGNLLYDRALSIETIRALSVPAFERLLFRSMYDLNAEHLALLRTTPHGSLYPPFYFDYPALALFTDLEHWGEEEALGDTARSVASKPFDAKIDRFFPPNLKEKLASPLCAASPLVCADGKPTFASHYQIASRST
jgi:hypothetical protein